MTVKCSPHSLHLIYSNVIGTSLDAEAPRLRLQPGGCAKVSTVYSILWNWGFNIPEVEIEQGPPVWKIPLLTMTFT